MFRNNGLTYLTSNTHLSTGTLLALLLIDTLHIHTKYLKSAGIGKLVLFSCASVWRNQNAEFSTRHHVQNHLCNFVCRVFWCNDFFKVVDLSEAIHGLFSWIMNVAKRRVQTFFHFKVIRRTELAMSPLVNWLLVHDNATWCRVSLVSARPQCSSSCYQGYPIELDRLDTQSIIIINLMFLHQIKSTGFHWNRTFLASNLCVNFDPSE